MTYKKVILENGLTVVLADMPYMESVSVGVWIGVGGRYEDKKQSGISHFLEHMVFKGTKKRSAKELKETIEGRGGALNGFTGEEFTCYLAKVMSKDAALAIDVLVDMTLNPVIAKSDFDKEKFVILEEIKMYMDMPNHYVHELLAELLWPNQPLGMPLAGTFKTVSAMTEKDLALYREDFYSPGNIMISVAGKLPQSGLIEMIKKNFSKTVPHPRRNYTAVELSQKAPAVNFHYKKTEQTHAALGIHGVSRFSRDKYSLDLMNIILGGNMSSRLFNEVREKLGLAYEISSSIKHYHDTGAVVIAAGIDNKKLGAAMKVILAELKKIRTRKVTKQEFIRAKEFYRGQLSMLFEETMHHMLWLGEKFICGDHEFREQDVLGRIDKVTIGDIKRISEDIFKPSNLNLAVVGPVKTAVQKEISKRLFDI
ncbi:MAG: pitrilysin family protein [Candidatus Omnitrophica bacterium]|nr:pitrilysin family protein [Candidatus Omnitrophota bacterium]